jgi:hypothetical protein
MAGEVERLSGKLGLDTTDFKTAIAAANRELRVLESGFKASAATLTDWTKDATGLENRVKSLNSQMDVQKLKVAALAAEHKRLVAEHGKGSRAAQDIEIKLNKETETLHKMERELDQTEVSLREMGDESKDTAKDVDKLEKEQEQATSAGQKFRKMMDATAATAKGLGRVLKTLLKGFITIGAAVAAAAIGLVAFTVGPASDLNETISKTEVVFGSASGKVLAFGENSAAALGLSKNAALGAAATYGNLLRAMGLGEDAAADMSIELVQLASDLASFNNMDPTEVLEKLRAGLTGEAEPLKVLGVNMNEARIKAKALELGLVTQGEELSAAAKAQAAYAIILEDTTLAQGDFARTMEGQANQQRIFTANIENLRAKLGQAFLPIVNAVTTAFNKLFSSAEFGDVLEDLIAWFGELAKSLEPVLDAFVFLAQRLLGGDGLFTVFEDGSSILEGFFERLGMGEGDARALAEQINGVANAIGDFVNGTLIPFVREHAEEIKAAFIGIGVALAAAGIVGAIAAIVAAINPVTLIIAAIAAAVGLMAAAWEGNWLNVRTRYEQVWAVLQPALQQLWNWLSVAIPAALQTLSDFWTGTLLPAIQNVWGFMQNSVFPLFRAIADFLGAVFGLAVRVLAGIWQNVLLPALQKIWGFLDANVLPIFRTVAEYLTEKFRPVIEGIATYLKGPLANAFGGISNAIKGVIDWLSQMAEKINNLELPDWLTPGSPTPWEIGLIGINQAMQQLNRTLPVMARGLNQVGAMGASTMGSLAGTGVGSTSVQNDKFQFFAPVVIQDVQPDALGGRLRARRY